VFGHCTELSDAWPRCGVIYLQDKGSRQCLLYRIPLWATEIRLLSTTRPSSVSGQSKKSLEPHRLNRESIAVYNSNHIQRVRISNPSAKLG
jgi:hypothetical protein